jgi:hypothetical protein
MADSEGSPKDQSQLNTHLYFLKKVPKYATVKPYTCRFDTQGKYPYTNIENVKQAISLSNVRPIQDDMSLQNQGFRVLTIPSRMSYTDFNNDDKIRAIHIPQILTFLQTELGAFEIHVLDYRVAASSHVLYYSRLTAL